MCGNGVIDTCYAKLYNDSPCVGWQRQTELCDGANTPSCASQGYLAGTTLCGSSCTIDVLPCDACGSDARVVECKRTTSIYPQLLVASAPGAAGGPYLAYAAGASLEVLHHDAQGFSIVGSIDLTGGALAIAPMSNGWLVFGQAMTSLYVSHVDLLATTKTDHALVTLAGNDELAWNPSIAYGPGGHGLVAWTEYTNNASQIETWMAVVDATGAIVVAPSRPVPVNTNSRGSQVTTDGTSFLLALSGEILRIASDGNIKATVTGYPLVDNPGEFSLIASWGASAGWYGARDAIGNWQAQQFDATGAAVGGVVQVAAGPVSMPFASGSDLISSTSQPAPFPNAPFPFSVTRNTPSGTSTSVPVGVTTNEVVSAPFAGDIAVAWPSGPGQYMALVAL